MVWMMWVEWMHLNGSIERNMCWEHSLIHHEILDRDGGDHFGHCGSFHCSFGGSCPCCKFKQCTSCTSVMWAYVSRVMTKCCSTFVECYDNANTPQRSFPLPPLRSPLRSPLSSPLPSPLPSLVLAKLTWMGSTDSFSRATQCDAKQTQTFTWWDSETGSPLESDRPYSAPHAIWGQSTTLDCFDVRWPRKPTQRKETRWNKLARYT